MSVTIRRSEQPPWTVLSAGGDLDVVGAPELRQAVVTVVSEGARLLVLDLSDLDFVDSFGIGAVVGALKRLRQRGGDLALVCPTPRIRRVFEICDLDRILAFHDSMDSLTEPSVAGSTGAASSRRRP